MKRIAIHSVPRSGSTWLGTIFDAHPNVIYKLQPLFSYAFKDMLSPHSTQKEIDTFFDELEKTKDDFLDQKEGKQKGIIPTFSKELPKAIVYKEVRYHHVLKNLLEKDKNLKVVGLIRNPLSVISSWLKAPKEFRPEKGWKIEEEWRFASKKNLNKPEEFNGYEKWKEVMAMFEGLQENYPSRFYLLNYEGLLSNKVETVKNIFAFCGLNIHKQVIDFIQKSSSVDHIDAYSVFKNKKKDDSWKQDLPNYVIEEILSDPDFIHYNKKYNWI